MDGLVQGVFLLEEDPVQGVTGLVAVIQRPDIAAGTERLVAGAEEHHCLDGIITGPVIQLPVYRLHHVQGQGIQALGPIQGQVAATTPDLDNHFWLVVTHSPSFM